ncbi:hypothetical protein C4588_01825 [Candidatus Parcubacteria bacterium]|nr:MAG: hypothetical protein C4588_01825 [Candidatus Parcubacteria bacterium]
MNTSTITMPDIKDFERRRFENFIKEKNFLEVRKLDDETYEVSNPEKNVFYRVTKNMTEDGVVFAECTCKDFTGRCMDFTPIPARCKHIFACLDWHKTQTKKPQEAEKSQQQQQPQEQSPQPEKENREPEREEKNMEAKKFDPQKYLIKVKGKDYLEVKFRLHWFRTEHKDWGIQTTIQKLDLERGIAVVKAEVFDEKGNLRSSGMKMELQKNFFDYCEKAETGAIGRALAALGYGTLQTFDLDEGIENGRIADSPVQLPAKNAVRGKNGNGNGKTGIKNTDVNINKVIERW